MTTTKPHRYDILTLGAGETRESFHLAMCRVAEREAREKSARHAKCRLTGLSRDEDGVRHVAPGAGWALPLTLLAFAVWAFVSWHLAGFMVETLGL